MAFSGRMWIRLLPTILLQGISYVLTTPILLNSVNRSVRRSLLQAMNFVQPMVCGLGMMATKVTIGP